MPCLAPVGSFQGFIMGAKSISCPLGRRLSTFAEPQGTPLLFALRCARAGQRPVCAEQVPQNEQTHTREVLYTNPSFLRHLTCFIPIARPASLHLREAGAMGMLPLRVVYPWFWYGLLFGRCLW